VEEARYDELLSFQDSDRFSESEKAALTWTSAIMWDSGIADDALWERLRASFTTEELVELGFFIGLTLGQQRWIKTLDLRHHEVLAGTDGGLAAEAGRDGTPSR